MISAVVLTKNEEKSIKRCLRSLSWCDEIIVIDDFSYDQTIALAKKHGARVFPRHLDRDFAAQRNFGLQKASGNWILFVDADEVVSPKLQGEIIQVSQENASASLCEGYFIKRKDYFQGRWLNFGETAQVRLLRLGKSRAGEWARPVHEIWQIKGRVCQLKNPLLHYHDISLSQFLERINYYTRINARILSQKGRRESCFTILFFPFAKFIQNYFLRLGFLDGFPGFNLAFLMSLHSLVTRIKIRELQNEKNN